MLTLRTKKHIIQVDYGVSDKVSSLPRHEAEMLQRCSYKPFMNHCWFHWLPSWTSTKYKEKAYSNTSTMFFWFCFWADVSIYSRGTKHPMKNKEI